MSPHPVWPVWFLRGVCLLLMLAVVVCPALPREWFIAIDPVYGGVYTISRGHHTIVPFHLLWALDGFRRIPVAGRVFMLGVIAALALVPKTRRAPAWIGRFPLGALGRVKTYQLALAGAVLSAAVCYLLRVSPQKNVEFGDAWMLVREIDGGWAVASDVLTYDVFLFVRDVLRLFTSSSPSLLAMVLTSCLSGGVFAAAVIGLARYAGQTRTEAWALGAGAALAGYAAMFFGYVETTQVEVAAMAIYFAFAPGALRGPRSSLRLAYLVLALVGLTFALMAHAAGLLLLPSAALLVLADAALPERTWRRAVWSKMFLRNAALTFIVVAVPYFQVVVVPHYLEGNFGNITGGVDSIMFVPWHVDPAAPPSECVYYSFLSPWQLADLGSAMLIGAPLAIPLCLCAGVWAWRGRARLNRDERWHLAVLASAAGACFLIPLTWNHDFGMWGDWNLAVCYLFPLNLFAWTAFLMLARPWLATPGFARRTIAPLILTQAVLGLGMLLQLW